MFRSECQGESGRTVFPGAAICALRAKRTDCSSAEPELSEAPRFMDPAVPKRNTSDSNSMRLPEVSMPPASWTRLSVIGERGADGARWTKPAVPAVGTAIEMSAFSFVLRMPAFSTATGIADATVELIVIVPFAGSRVLTVIPAPALPLIATASRSASTAVAVPKMIGPALEKDCCSANSKAASERNSVGAAPEDTETESLNVTSPVASAWAMPDAVRISFSNTVEPAERIAMDAPAPEPRPFGDSAAIKPISPLNAAGPEALSVRLFCPLTVDSAVIPPAVSVVFLAIESGPDQSWVPVAVIAVVCMLAEPETERLASPVAVSSPVESPNTALPVMASECAAAAIGALKLTVEPVSVVFAPSVIVSVPVASP